ncbi:CAP domain-containing protein [Methylobacterium sp. A54F]
MTAPTSLEKLFLQLINEARAGVGAKALTFDGELLDASDAHSAWMDQTDTFSHTGVNGSSPGTRLTSAGYGWQGYGENIAYVSGELNEASVRQLHSNLMNSPGHYANIVKGSFEEVGIGLRAGTINGRNVVFVTEDFGTPNAAERAEPNDTGTTVPTTPTPVAGQTLNGTSRANTLSGGSGDDLISGRGGNDALNGGLGNDTLYGAQGNDVLTGGGGNDVLSGDLGADRYVFGQNSGRDLVLGFSQAQGDRLALGGQAFQVGATASGNTLLTLSGGGTVELSGVSRTSFGTGAGYLA